MTEENVKALQQARDALSNLVDAEALRDREGEPQSELRGFFLGFR